MKRTLSFMVMALALLLTQCRKPEVKFPSPVAPEGTTVSMTVTAGPGSKTDITTAGDITWSTGDKLYVGFDGKYVGYLTLTSGQNTPTGWFSGNVTLPNGTTGEQMFHFFYLGSNPPAVSNGAASTTVSFASQTGLRDGLGSCHVGHGSAKGAVSAGGVTGISVMMKSEVALSRFSFKKSGTSATPYIGALTLSGDHIYNSMTVGFGGTFSGTKTGGGEINLTHTTSSEKYVMLVPAGTNAATLKFDAGSGTTDCCLANGIEANKYYHMPDGSAIEVEVTAPAPTLEYVDLGLSVKWATCNLGAEHPYDYGNYYAWGETAGYDEAMVGAGANCGASYSPGTVKTNYTWAYYKWGCGNNKLGKYVNKTGYGMTKPDNLTTLLPEDDAATANWGSDWRMPTADEFTELKNNTNYTWKAANVSITIGGQTVSMPKAGYYCVSTKAGYTDKYIFIPAAGYLSETSIVNQNKIGIYYSSSIDESNINNPMRLYIAGTPTFSVMGNIPRYSGYSVRPVYDPQN